MGEQMKQLTLEFPVFTLDQKELLAAGTVLTEQVLAEVAALGRLEVLEEMPLLEYGSVRADLERFISIAPYSEIFVDSSQVETFFLRARDVVLPEPLLKSLDYFRQHDFHTYRHILMVFSLSLILTEQLQGGDDGPQVDYLAGPAHDFGKICIPLHVLKKCSPLTPRERRMLNGHPLAGYVLLTYYFKDHNHPTAVAARDHHERRNGSGYPRGIHNVNPQVEIVAVCDVYDALLSPRPYRPLSFDNRTAIEELTSMAERGEIGWDGVTALVALNRGKLAERDQVDVSRDKRGTPPIGNCYGLLAEEEPAVRAVQEIAASSTTR
jgi:HD-GYP domain-containing protein (c-di-GMP phosphodiesterase class II)